MRKITKIKFKLQIEAYGVQDYDQNVDCNNFNYWGNHYSYDQLKSTAFARKNFLIDQSGNIRFLYKISSNRLIDAIYGDYVLDSEAIQNLHQDENALIEFATSYHGILQGLDSGVYSKRPTLVIGDAIELNRENEPRIIQNNSVFENGFNNIPKTEFIEYIGLVTYQCNGYFDIEELAKELDQNQIDEVINYGKDLLLSLNYSNSLDFYGKTIRLDISEVNEESEDDYIVIEIENLKF
jgi:hypothetical protein